MSVKIQTQFQGPGFVAVPNHVARDPRLSLEARGLLIWLASHGNDAQFSVAAICDACGIGKDKWQRIARELRAVGALVNVKVRGRGGRVLGEVLAVRWPEPAPDREPGKPAAGDREPGKPAAGKAGSSGPGNPALKSRETRLLIKEQRKRLSARERIVADLVADGIPQAEAEALAEEEGRRVSRRGAKP